MTLQLQPDVDDVDDLRFDGPELSDTRTRSETLGLPNARRDAHASGLAREVTRVMAHGRLEGALRSIAVDLLGPNESDEIPARSANWVATTTEALVSRVSDSALDALVSGLDSLLDAVPPDVARHLDRTRSRHDAGFD